MKLNVSDDVNFSPPLYRFISLCASQVDIVGMVNEIVGFMSQRVSSLIPKTRKDLDIFLNVPKRQGLKKIEEMMAFGTTDARNNTWIEENGICLDNIIPKRSTLKQAGKGAFAQRFIQQGTIVVPVPLLPILNKDALDMFDLSDDGNHDVGAKRKVVGRQLLLNYCFGHTESSMLLCPSSNAILINHCSGKNLIEGDCTKRGPNAEIRWAKWDKTNKSWLNASLQTLQRNIENDQRGLSFDVVALRDIKAGEEVSDDLVEKIFSSLIRMILIFYELRFLSITEKNGNRPLSIISIHGSHLEKEIKLQITNKLIRSMKKTRLVQFEPKRN